MSNVKSSVMHVAYRVLPRLRPRAVGAPIAKDRGDADVLERQRQAKELRQLLDEMEAESGPIPPDVRDRINALPWPD